MESTYSPRTKRERGENWGKDAKFALVELVGANLHVIENKSQDGDMLKLKKETWRAIGEKMEAAGHNSDLVKMKQQWMRLKAAARRSIVSHKRFQSVGGHPVKSPSSVDWAVYRVVPHEFEKDIMDLTKKIAEEYPGQVLHELDGCELLQDPLTSISENSANSEELPVLIKEEKETVEEDGGDYCKNPLVYFGEEDKGELQETVPGPGKRKPSQEMSPYEKQRLEQEERRLALEEKTHKNREARENELHALKKIKIQKEIEFLDLQIVEQLKKQQQPDAPHTL